MPLDKISNVCYGYTLNHRTATSHGTRRISDMEESLRVTLGPGGVGVKGVCRRWKHCWRLAFNAPLAPPSRSDASIASISLNRFFALQTRRSLGDFHKTSHIGTTDPLSRPPDPERENLKETSRFPAVHLSILTGRSSSHYARQRAKPYGRRARARTAL